VRAIAAATLRGVTSVPAPDAAPGTLAPADTFPSIPTQHRGVGAALRRWAAGGAGTVGVVRLLDRHGLGTVEAGQLLVAAPDGEIAGLLLHGALDRHAVPLSSRPRAVPTPTS
jgi:hypothetical protein